MKIFNIGSLNIDHVYKVPYFVMPGETLTTESLEDICGGKGLNQSIALARAGIKNLYHIGAVGKDGEILKEALAKDNINMNFLEERDSVSGHTVIQVNEDGENCILRFPGANHTIEEKQVDEALKISEDGDYILLQNETNILQYILEHSEASNLKIALNPSPMTKSLLSLDFNKIDFLILNEIEAKMLLDLDLKIDVSGDELLDKLKLKFPHMEIVLTLGVDGAMVQVGEKRVCQPAYKVDTVDTTGAGDTFCGYYLASRMENKSIEESLELASKAAAIAVTRKGATPSIPYYDEVLKFN